MNKCVWLNIETGEFSNSWEVDENGDSVDIKACTKEKLLKDIKDTKRLYGEKISTSNYKLIQYTCHSDSEFEFSHLMKLR